jgi:thiamine biosynthesis lipoprotein ApbE
MIERNADRQSLPDRRLFLTLGIGAFVVASLPRAMRPGRRLVRRKAPVMGTIAEVTVAHQNPRYAQGAIDSALDALRWVDRTMTRFNGDSDVGQANRLAATRPVVISEPTADVLLEALRWADASDGAFDPCLANAVVLWDVEQRASPPLDAHVRRYANRRLYRSLEVDRRLNGAPVVSFRDRDMAIDLGGIAKGYGVDRAVDALRQWGIRNALVNVGGDLYALGVSEDGDPWEIGIRSSDDRDRITHTVRVQDRAIATSGDYEQFFEHRGRRYHHLLDPVTGAPRRSRLHSVTVSADTCMTADVAGTAVFGCLSDRARQLVTATAKDAEIVHIA